MKELGIKILCMINMNSKVYKCCAVPHCHNTSIKTPNKLFVYVPHNKTLRNKWLKLARRDPTSLSVNSAKYFCEDHFDLPRQMDNYMEYHVMGSVSQIRMKPGCIPTKFDCQVDRTKRTFNPTERPYIQKKQRNVLITECEIDSEDTRITKKCLQLGKTSSGNSDLHGNIENITQGHKAADKSIHKTSKKIFNIEDQFVSRRAPSCAATAEFDAVKIEVGYTPGINGLTSQDTPNGNDFIDSFFGQKKSSEFRNPCEGPAPSIGEFDAALVKIEKFEIDYNPSIGGSTAQEDKDFIKNVFNPNESMIEDQDNMLLGNSGSLKEESRDILLDVQDIKKECNLKMECLDSCENIKLKTDASKIDYSLNMVHKEIDLDTGQWGTWSNTEHKMEFTKLTL